MTQLLENATIALEIPTIVVVCFYIVLAALGKIINFVEQRAYRKLQEQYDAEDMLRKLES